ncbi:MAG TPA: FGGY family carbohydrate kinase [Candidatus Eisenbacteria bacterium]|nr:FGGY family carbohydrate kinase [Candidatus Eisenbacteria bacterium]
MVEPGAISPERADRPLVLALDVGSSSVRAALYDGRGRALRGCAVQVPYAWNVASDGSVRLSHLTLLDLVGRTLDEITATAGSLASEVVAGGISCFFHSIVGLDDGGRPITPVLSWADTTSAAAAAALRKQIDPKAVHACTGVPIHASYWPARVIRLRQEQPAIRRWAGFPELLAESLTGRAAVSRSMASGTGLLDRARGTWSELVLEHLGIAPRDLPTLVADDEPIGRMSSNAADRWPRLAQAAWFAPWGDGGCGNVGLAAAGPGKAALMVGTSGALRAIVADPAPSILGGLFAYRLGAGAVVGGQLSEGGGMLAWVSRLLGRSLASLERAAAGMPADTHGLTVLPYTFGERGLGYHDGARGSLTGLSAGTDAAAIYRAIVESIAYGFAAIDDRLSDVLRGIPAIVASGGALTHSPLLAQVLADSLGRDIGIAPALEASRRGAALLALRGAGLLDDLMAIPGPPTRTIRSDPDRSARYRAARARQNALYETILDASEPWVVGAPEAAAGLRPARPSAA